MESSITQLDPKLILIFLVGYFLVLFGISWLTTRKANNDSFYSGNHQSPWYVLAYGLIGTSISGISLISVTGNVVTKYFSYMQIVFGYTFGYIMIAYILLPIYYKFNVTSIYQYLEMRYGKFSQKTGAVFFLISRNLGAAIRLSMMAVILHNFVFSKLFPSMPFAVTVFFIIAMIYIYTFKGGIKTIVWTDTLQSTLLLATVVVSIVMVKHLLGQSWGEIGTVLYNSKITDIVPFGWFGKNSFVENFMSGVFITLAMTGLDQAMMQRSLSAKSLKDAQKNILSFSVIVIVVNFLLLITGAMLAFYVINNDITIANTDNVFFQVATNKFGLFAGGLFILGFAAATFSSSDDAMTAITTSFAVDFLKWDDDTPEWKRKVLHALVGFVLFLLIVIFFSQSKQAAIEKVLLVASYTYAPLLGLFMFGILSKRKVEDFYVMVIAILTPLIALACNLYLGMLNVMEDPIVYSDVKQLSTINRILYYVSHGNGNITIVYSSILCAMMLFVASRFSKKANEIV